MDRSGVALQILEAEQEKQVYNKYNISYKIQGSRKESKKKGVHLFAKCPIF